MDNERIIEELVESYLEEGMNLEEAIECAMTEFWENDVIFNNLD